LNNGKTFFKNSTGRLVTISRVVFGLLLPAFEKKVLEKLPDGMLKVVNEDGVIVLEKPGVRSILPEVDHLLKSRQSWEEHFGLPRMPNGRMCSITVNGCERHLSEYSVWR
jgi:hypothetical protein